MLAKLDERGVGEVFKARDTRLDRFVAVRSCLTRDGRFLMNVTPEASPDLAPITIVQNWTALLKE